MTSIFVAKLDFGVTNDQLKEIFEAYGTVNKALVATDRETGKPRGFAFVEMPNADEAQQAIEALDGHIINGRSIAVKEAEQRANDNRPQQRPAFSSPRPQSDSRPTERPADFKAPSPASSSPSFDSPKLEPRKKSKDKERRSGDDDNRNKKPKMDAYRKSGKGNRYFDDDDDDDLDDELLNYKRPDEDDFLDDEDEDEDF
ncbi:MAG: hypothetical protein RLZZ301_292 [Bacteroidota bacterium]|jgi:RNA recognition motif-containing protein